MELSEFGDWALICTMASIGFAVCVAMACASIFMIVWTFSALRGSSK